VALVAAGAEAVRCGARGLYVWVLSSRVAKAVGVGGLVAAAYGLGGPALASTLGGLVLTVAAAVARLPNLLLSLFGRTAAAR
jgi:hypothetical protein